MLVPIYVGISWFAPERFNLEGVLILRVSMVVALACVLWATHGINDVTPGHR